MIKQFSLVCSMNKYFMSIMNNQLSQHTVWYMKYQTVLENMVILLL